MNKQLFLFFFLTSLSFHCAASEIVLSTSLSTCPYSEKEIELFENLSQRHLALLKKEAELKAKEEVLNRKLQEQNLNTEIQQKTKKSFAQIYGQMPPSKAVQLLNLETPQKAAEILSELPPATAGLLINKTELDRAQLILQHMSELQAPLKE